jgi:hypothetical protein
MLIAVFRRFVPAVSLLNLKLSAAIRIDFWSQNPLPSRLASRGFFLAEFSVQDFLTSAFCLKNLGFFWWTGICG